MGIEAEIKKWEEGRRKGITVDDFYCVMNAPNSFIFVPTREIWPAKNVDASLPGIPTADGKISPSAWLAANRPVVQLTWMPGEPVIVKDAVMADTGFIKREGCDIFNQYRGPAIEPGDAAAAGLWLDHIDKVFSDDAEHIIKWLAHRVQKPQEKINHALLLVGEAQGIGKDTTLEPVRHAIGSWNFGDISPQNLLGRFNAYLKSVILRVNEARDMGNINRYALYERMKWIIAAPPDTLRVDEKNMREFAVPNVTGVIITSNHKAGGLYLPAVDRRHYVACTEALPTDFTEDYWRRLWSWYDAGGTANVYAYLKSLDLCGFDPKAPPKKTPAFWEIVEAGRAPEEIELADVIEYLGSPDAFALSDIKDNAKGEFELWLRSKKNSKIIGHFLVNCGYGPAINPERRDGRWRVNGKPETIYAKLSLSAAERAREARRLADGQ